MKRFGLLCFILLIAVNSVSSAAEVDGIETRPPFIAELRVGILAHNVGPLSAKEEGGVDVNIEVHFQAPKLFSFIGEPQPFIGTSINIAGNTSFLYAGFMWDVDITESFFASLGLGVTVHNGNSGEMAEGDGLTALGCWWLFRESFELGVKADKQVSIAVYVDHVSHGGFCSDSNRGMDNTGLRLHYKF